MRYCNNRKIFTIFIIKRVTRYINKYIFIYKFLFTYFPLYNNNNYYCYS